MIAVKIEPVDSIFDCRHKAIISWVLVNLCITYSAFGGSTQYQCVGTQNSHEAFPKITTYDLHGLIFVLHDGQNPTAQAEIFVSDYEASNKWMSGTVIDADSNMINLKIPGDPSLTVDRQNHIYQRFLERIQSVAKNGLKRLEPQKFIPFEEGVLFSGHSERAAKGARELSKETRQLGFSEIEVSHLSIKVPQSAIEGNDDTFIADVFYARYAMEAVGFDRLHGLGPTGKIDRQFLSLKTKVICRRMEGADFHSEVLVQSTVPREAADPQNDGYQFVVADVVSSALRVWAEQGSAEVSGAKKNAVATAVVVLGGLVYYFGRSAGAMYSVVRSLSLVPLVAVSPVRNSVAPELAQQRFLDDEDNPVYQLAEQVSNAVLEGDDISVLLHGANPEVVAALLRLGVRLGEQQRRSSPSADPCWGRPQASCL